MSEQLDTKEVKQVIEEISEPTTPPPKERWSWRNPHISLGAFLAIVIIAAAGIVGVGHLLYISSNEYKLDITRPGLKDIQANELVEVNRNENYDTTSAVDRAALDKEIQSATSRLEDFGRYGDFADPELLQMQENLVGEQQSAQ